MSPTVPDTLEEVLTPAWLSMALGRRFPGIDVASVQPGPIVSRVSTNARFHVECRGNVPPGLPTDLCVKGYFADCSDTASASRTAGVPEALFYRHLAGGTGVRTLDCIYADVDPVTRHGVVITGDVVAEGATFLDALSPYSSDQAAESLEQYAILHGRTWERGRSDEPWLAPRLEATMSAGSRRSLGTSRVRSVRRCPQGARPRAPRGGRPSARAPVGRGGATMPAPRRRPRREPLPRCGRTPLPRGLATRPAWPVVSRRGLPHRLHTEYRGAPP